MKPYISIDELKYDIQQQADNLPEYIMKDYSPDKINLHKAIEVYYKSKDLLGAVPPKELFKTLNHAIMDTLRDGEENADDFQNATEYIKHQVWHLTQISNFIACAIPD